MEVYLQLILFQLQIQLQSQVSSLLQMLHLALAEASTNIFVVTVVKLTTLWINAFFCMVLPPGFGRGKGKSIGSNSSGSYHNRSINCVEDSSNATDLKVSPLAAMNLSSMDQYQQLVNLLQSQFHNQNSLNTPSDNTQFSPSESGSTSSII